MTETVITATTAASTAFTSLVTIPAGGMVLVGATALQDQEFVKLGIQHSTSLYCPIVLNEPDKSRVIKGARDAFLTADNTMREVNNNTATAIVLGYFKSGTKTACSVVAWS